MTADSVLVLVVGLMAGFCLGYVTAWRFARKLEHHEVVLAEWDQPWDSHAPLGQRRPAVVHELSGTRPRPQ